MLLLVYTFLLLKKNTLWHSLTVGTTFTNGGKLFAALQIRQPTRIQCWIHEGNNLAPARTFFFKLLQTISMRIARVSHLLMFLNVRPNTLLINIQIIWNSPLCVHRFGVSTTVITAVTLRPMNWRIFCEIYWERPRKSTMSPKINWSNIRTQWYFYIYFEYKLCPSH